MMPYFAVMYTFWDKLRSPPQPNTDHDGPDLKLRKRIMKCITLKNGLYYPWVFIRLLESDSTKNNF